MDCVHCKTPVPTNSRFCLSCGADLSDPGGGPRTTSSPDALHSKLAAALTGRYRITRMVGRGGMGAVFLAEDLTLERPVAIKVLPPDVSRDENLVGRFAREARTAAGLDHPNIIPIFSVESAEDLHFFVMKFVDGISLESRVAEGPMPIDECKRILWEAARALGHAHERGVVHRDIKPGNIMLEREDRVLVADFGISKATQAATQLTGTGQVIGTPHYMSPEQVMGQAVDGRSDQYSMAVMGYQMLTGRLPIEDEGVHTVLYKHIFEEPERVERLRPDTPEYLANAIHRAMSKDPSDRFPTMEDFADTVWPEQAPVGGSTPHPRSTRSPGVSTTAPTEITAARSDPTVRTSVATKPRRVGRRLGWAAALLLTVGGLGYAAWSQGLLSSLLPVATDGESPQAASGTDGAPATAAVAVPDSAEVAVDSTGPVANALQSQPEARDLEPPPTRPATTPSAENRRRQTNPGRGDGRPQRDVAPAQPQFGFLTVDADPFGMLFIDGVEIGITPVARHRLRPGEHIIRITRDGCRDMIDTVTVSPGTRATVRKNLVCSR